MKTARQLVSFCAIGIASNGLLYLFYLALTGSGLGHKTAMTLAFATGVLWTYLLNRRWTFRHSGGIQRSAWRYAGTYLLAYALNVCALVILVDMAGLSHETVVLTLVVTTAGLTFLLQKLWVFEDAPERRMEI